METHFSHWFCLENIFKDKDNLVKMKMTFSKDEIEINPIHPQSGFSDPEDSDSEDAGLVMPQVYTEENVNKDDKNSESNDDEESEDSSDEQEDEDSYENTMYVILIDERPIAATPNKKTAVATMRGVASNIASRLDKSKTNINVYMRHRPNGNQEIEVVSYYKYYIISYDKVICKVRMQAVPLLTENVNE